MNLFELAAPESWFPATAMQPRLKAFNVPTFEF